MSEYKSLLENDAKNQGLYVSAVYENNGFLVGDRIIGIDGEKITTYEQMQGIVFTHKAGDDVTVIVLRGGEPTEIRILLTDADFASRSPDEVA